MAPRDRGLIVEVVIGLVFCLTVIGAAHVLKRSMPRLAVEAERVWPGWAAP